MKTLYEVTEQLDKIEGKGGVKTVGYFFDQVIADKRAEGINTGMGGRKNGDVIPIDVYESFDEWAEKNPEDYQSWKENNNETFVQRTLESLNEDQIEVLASLKQDALNNFLKAKQ